MPFAPQISESAWLLKGADQPVLERGGYQDYGYIHPEPWLTIPNVFRLLRRRMGLIVACTTVLSLLGIGATRLLQPSYRAETLIVVDPRREQISNVPDVVSALPAEQAVLRSEVDTLRSHQLTRRVVREADLSAIPEFNPALQVGPPWSWIFWLDNEQQQEVRRAVMLSIEPVLSALGMPMESAEVGVPDISEGDRIAITAALYQKKLNVLTDGRSLTIRLAVNSRDPELAAKLANLHAELYLAQQMASKSAATERAHVWLQERLPGLKADLQRAESVVQNFRAEHQLITSGHGTTIIAQQLADLNTQITLARAEKAQNQARYAQVRELMRSGGALDSVPDIIASPLVQRLREQESLIRRLEADAAARYVSGAHPSIISAKAQLRELQEAVKSEMGKIAGSLQRAVEVSSVKERTLEQALSELTKRAATANMSEIKLRELERDAEATSGLYQTLLNRLRETSVGPAAKLPDSRIISNAEIPLWPAFPQYMLFYAASVAVAVATSIGLVILLEGSQDQLRSPNQCGEMVGVRGLGLVPQVKAWHRRKVVDCVVDHRGIPRDAVRAVFELLLAPRSGEKIGSITITSTVPDEGKTILAIWLARVSALTGRKVLLVDADLRRPSVARYLGPPGAGRSLGVESGQELQNLAAEDAKTGMHYVTCRRHGDEIFGAESLRRLEALLRHARESYDLIVVDSAPVLAAPESLSVCQLTDGVIFAVRWGRTPYRQVRHGASMLRCVGANLIGAVVTRVNVRKHSTYAFGDVGDVYQRHSTYYGA